MKKYTKYIYVDSRNITGLYGEMPEDRMTAEEMISYLYDRRYIINWKEDRDENGDPFKYTILPVFSEELDPQENTDMIWKIYSSDYIDGLEFMRFHEGQLRELLGDEKYDELLNKIEYNETLHRYEVIEEITHNVKARVVTIEEFTRIRNSTEEEYLYVDGVGLLINHGRSHYDDTTSWYLYNREMKRWEWDWEEEE